MKSHVVVVWVFVVHLAGLYLFTRGFLLTRLSLSEFNLDAPSLIPTHKRAVLFIIDALRFDFISPSPPSPPSPYHHNILTLPYELTQSHPDHSLIFYSFADPPTLTLPRIKALITGSLPTFIDMGSNFGGSSIEEDSIIRQLRLAGKRVAFVGDDTWMTVFPDSFERTATFPYDSFNVEDLHTVDEGVIRHIFPLLEQETKSWDFLIAHGLGVDHVGHRVGPDHPSMKAKLEQMNDVLTRIVKVLDPDTLLIVMGDHGMDRRGNHGGDGYFETSPGIWLYSKGTPFIDRRVTYPPPSLRPNATFWGSSTEFRFVQQIDLVPSLSLLLGLPIPFNNLGAVIPELFHRRDEYEKALEINAAQVKKYLDTYRSSPAGRELDSAWTELQLAWGAIPKATTATQKLISTYDFLRIALSSCRSMWAQFNVSLMIFGLAIFLVGLVATWALFSRIDDVSNDLDAWCTKILLKNLRFTLIGTASGVLTPFLVTHSSVSLVDHALFGTVLASCLHIIYHLKLSLSWALFKSFPLLLLLHSLAFASNSFTFWEDRVVLLLLITSILPFVLVGFKAPTDRLRYRILGFSALFAVCVRLIGISTVCREEQQPYCHVTFFASSSLPSPPLPVLVLIIPTAFALPSILNRFLTVSKSDNGISSLILPWVLRPVLLLGSGCWILEWMESSNILGHEWATVLRLARTVVAWIAMCVTLVVGPTLWWLVPACLLITTEPSAGGDEKKKVMVLGFANAYGAPYLILWTLFFGALFVVTQLTGQIILALTVVAVVSYLEVVDSVRDVKGLNKVMNSANPSTLLQGNNAMSIDFSVSFSEVIPLALFAIHTFHGTGHQSTIPSIQWKSAFLLTSTLTYPFSPALVFLNTLGPTFLLGLASPLVALWNVPPLPQPTSAIQVRKNTLKAALGMMMYFGCLTLSSAASAAFLRRHLMVWNVFAPRFMIAAVEGITVDLAVLLGVGLGVERIVEWISKLFRSASASDDAST